MFIDLREDSSYKDNKLILDGEFIKVLKVNLYKFIQVISRLLKKYETDKYLRNL
jgi:hypothetical protein